jgi:hypothetical protein
MIVELSTADASLGDSRLETQLGRRIAICRRCLLVLDTRHFSSDSTTAVNICFSMLSQVFGDTRKAAYLH